MSYRNMERAWKKILELAELPHRHFHALRHTHATELLAKGIPILEVSHRLGHAIKGFDNKIADQVSSIFIENA